MNKIFSWGVKKVQGFLTKLSQVLGFAGESERGSKSQEIDFGSKVTFEVGDEIHHLWVEAIDGVPQIIVASQKQRLDEILRVTEAKVEKGKRAPDVKQQVRARIGAIKKLANEVEASCAKLMKKGGVPQRDRTELQINLAKIGMQIRRIAQILAESGEGIGLQQRQNVAIVCYSLQKQGKTYSETLVVVSGENKWPLPEHRFFITRQVGRFSRAYDSEAKALEYIAQLLTKSVGIKRDVTGFVGIYSEFPVCPSCLGVVTQFRSKFPNIVVEIHGGKKYEV